MRTRADILDELLVLRIQRGERRAFELLVKRWQRKLYIRALRLSRDREAANDIVQDVWIGALRGIRRLEDPAHFSSWIHRILRNKSADWIRKKQSDRRLQDAVPNLLDYMPQSTIDSDSPIHRIREGIRRLPDADRTILTQFYLDEMSVREIAIALDIPEGTVKSRLYHARLRLKHKMED